MHRHNFANFFGVFTKLRKATVSFVMSVRPSICPSVRMEQLGSNWMEFQAICYLRIFRKNCRNISLQSDKNNGHFTRRQLDFFLSYLTHFFLEWKILQTKAVEPIKTQILRSITFFFGNNAVYEIMWKNIVDSCRLQMTIRRMRIESWIRKATKTRSEYVIFNFFFPRQQW